MCSRDLAIAVVDAFEGACGRVLGRAASIDHGGASHRPVLMLLLDHVLLLLQDHVYVTVTLREQESSRAYHFSSLSDRDRAYFGLPAVEDEDRSHHQRLASIFTRAGNELSLHAFGLPGRVGTWPPNHVAIQEFVAELLRIAAPHAEPALLHASSAPPPASAPTVSEEFWDRHIETLRQRLDPIIESYRECDLFPKDAYGRSRLFVVTRQPFTNPIFTDADYGSRVVRGDAGCTATYDYTARVLWTAHQLADRNLTPAQHRVLELPLHDGERAIADSSLTSGVIDVGVSAERSRGGSREKYHDSGLSRQRRELETLAYAATASEALYYIPVHIAGIPWLALFSFHKDADGSDRESLKRRRYRIYRDLVPTIADQLSQAVLHAYADALADSAIGRLNDSGDAPKFASGVSADWAAIGAIYPYGRAELAVQLDSDEEIRPLSDFSTKTAAKFGVRFHALDAGIPYRLLDSEFTRRVLDLRLTAAAQVATTARADQRERDVELTVHEWVKLQQDGIVRSELLKEKAIEADLDEGLLDDIYGLYGTLQGDLGLPWIINERSRKGTESLTTHYCPNRRATADDVEFLRILHEFYARVILSADTHGPAPGVEFRFRCATLPAYDTVARLGHGTQGLAAVGRRLTLLLKFLRPPWPLSVATANNVAMRQGLLSTITLGPRELLRNAIAYCDPEATTPIIFDVMVHLFDDGGGQITTYVANIVPKAPDFELANRLQDVARRARTIETAIRFTTCTDTYNPRTRELGVSCVLDFRGGLS